MRNVLLTEQQRIKAFNDMRRRAVVERLQSIQPIDWNVGAVDWQAMLALQNLLENRDMYYLAISLALAKQPSVLIPEPIARMAKEMELSQFGLWASMEKVPEVVREQLKKLPDFVQAAGDHALVNEVVHSYKQFYLRSNA